MTFLPIVERELRVSARKRGTYWTRVIIAVVSIGLGTCIFLGFMGLPEQMIAPRIFIGLSILSFCYCLLAGRRYTVDSLCEERREGTLGLLFLTDLKGHDIILGKLAATSLNGFFGLFALFPVLAATILMGGISSGQFWRMVLVLVNTFVFSLAIGIYSSARQSTYRRAAGYNLALIFLLAVLLPLAAAFVANSLLAHYFPKPVSAFTVVGPRGRAGFRALNSTRPNQFQSDSLVSMATSPIFAFVMAFDSNYMVHPAFFWISNGVLFALALAMIYRASRIVPRSWQDAATEQPAAAGKTAPPSLRQAEQSKRAIHRKSLLTVNAFYWLAARDRRKPAYVWIFLACMGVWWYWNSLGAGGFWFDVGIKITTSVILNTVFKLWIVLEAGHQLAEDKKNGAIELLLSSPLSVPNILRGQWLALRRQFFLPMVAMVFLQLLYFFKNPPGTPEYNHATAFVFIAAGILMLAADIFVLPLVAMYEALVARSYSVAEVRTVFRVLVLPWLVWGLIIGAINLYFHFTFPPGVFGPIPSSYIPGWKFYLGLWFGLGLLCDAVFGVLAWRQLRDNFRALAVGRFAPRQN